MSNKPKKAMLRQFHLVFDFKSKSKIILKLFNFIL